MAVRTTLSSRASRPSPWRIEPEVVIAAIEDAVLTASRKVFKTGETRRRGSIPTRPGGVGGGADGREQVETPATEISIQEARVGIMACGDEVVASVEMGDEMEF